MEIPAGVDDVSADVYDPDGNLERSTFRQDPDGLSHLRFTPTKAGQHKVNKMAILLLTFNLLPSSIAA